MNISVSVIVGAAVIGGSLLLAGERLADRMAQDSRCAGYLASAKGREASDLADTVARLKGEGVTSLRAISDALNADEIETPHGGAWGPSSVRNLLARLQA